METFRQLTIVFTHLSYVLMALATGFVVFSMAVWLSNVSLILTVLTSGTATILEKVNLLISLYGGIATNFTLLSATYTVLIAILFGIYIAVLVYVIRKRRQFAGTSSIAGAGGVLGGFFGIGCAACGSVIFSTFATVLGAGAVTALLPFGGQEFGVVGVLLLLIAIRGIVKKIEGTNMCVVRN
jgi:hypothetical protein